MKPSASIEAQIKARQSITTPMIIVFALRNLLYRKLRNSLTILGVVIGVGSIVLLLSLGLGLRNLVTKQVVGSKSVKTIDVVSQKSEIVPIDQRKIDQIKAISQVSQVAWTYSSPGTISYNDSNTGVAVFAANQGYIDLSSLKVSAGSVPMISREDEVVINSTVAKAIGFNDDKAAIGKSITVISDVKSADNKTTTINKKFTIRSVVESGKGAELFISDSIFRAARPSAYSQLKVVATGREHVESIRSQIESLGLNTTSPLDTLKQIDQVFSIFNIILVGFGGIGMIIAILGMLNTLTISLLERTKEIALLMTMGARGYDINRMFIIEAILISLIGGVLGILAAGTIGMVVDQYYRYNAATRGVNISVSFFSMPLALIAGALVFIVLVGVAVVIYPAFRASRINPVNILRRE